MKRSSKQTANKKASTKHTPTKKTRLLFVCYGNICRSPMAESIMAELVRKAGREDEFVIDSAGVAGFEDPAPPHPKTQRVLRKHHIPVRPHRRRVLRPSEYDDWDYIVFMDETNLMLLERLFSGDPKHKLRPMLEFAPAYARGRLEVDDPWFTGDYDTAYADITAGCQGLLEELTSDQE